MSQNNLENPEILYLSRKDISLILDINLRRLDRNLSPSNRDKFNVEDIIIEGVSYYKIDTLKEWCESKCLDYQLLFNYEKWNTKIIDELSKLARDFYNKNCSKVEVKPEQNDQIIEAVHTPVHTEIPLPKNDTNYDLKNESLDITKDYIEHLKNSSSENKLSFDKIIAILEQQSETINKQNDTISELNKTVQNQQSLTLQLQDKMDKLMLLSNPIETYEEKPKRKKLWGIF